MNRRMVDSRLSACRRDRQPDLPRILCRRGMARGRRSRARSRPLRRASFTICRCALAPLHVVVNVAVRIAVPSVCKYGHLQAHCTEEFSDFGGSPAYRKFLAAADFSPQLLLSLLTRL